MKLNPKQEAFCLHYAKTGNATESYKKAGYKVNTDGAAYAAANRLLKNVRVSERLKELADEIASSKIAGIREVQERLTAIARMEQEEEQVVVESTGDGTSEARIIKRKPQLKDALKAMELLGRMQGGFDNTVNLKVAPIMFTDDLEE